MKFTIRLYDLLGEKVFEKPDVPVGGAGLIVWNNRYFTYYSLGSSLILDYWEVRMYRLED